MSALKSVRVWLAAFAAVALLSTGCGPGASSSGTRSNPTATNTTGGKSTAPAPPKADPG